MLYTGEIQPTIVTTVEERRRLVKPRTTVLYVRIPYETYNRVVDLANRNGWSITESTKRLLETALANDG